MKGTSLTLQKLGAGLVLSAFPVWALAACTNSSPVSPQMWSMQGGFTADAGQTYSSTTAPGKYVEVYADMQPLPEHVGKKADVYLRLSTRWPGQTITPFESTIFFLNAEGQFEIDAAPSTSPFAQDVTLAARHKVRLFAGKLDKENSFTLSAVYCVDGQRYQAQSLLQLEAEYNGDFGLDVDFPPLTTLAYAGDTLTFRGTATGVQTFTNATVEISARGGIASSTVNADGSWSLPDVAVDTRMNMVLKIAGEEVASKQYTVKREPQWTDLEGMTLDVADRKAYVVDRMLQRVFSVDLDTGARSLIPQQSQPLQNLLHAPSDAALNSAARKLFVLDQAQARVASIQAGSTVLESFQPPPSTDVFSQIFPTTIRFRPATGEYYIGDALSGRIFRFNPQSGTTTQLAQLPVVIHPDSGSGLGAFSSRGVDGMFVDESNNRLLVVSRQDRKVGAIDLTTGILSVIFDEANGSLRDLPGIPINPAAPPPQPRGGYIAITHDTRRNLLIVADRTRIYSLNPVTNAATELYNGTSPLRRASEIRDIEYDATGDRYIFVDGDFNAVLALDASRRYLTELSSNSFFRQFELLSTLVPAEGGQTLLTFDHDEDVKLLNLQDNNVSYLKGNLGLLPTSIFNAVRPGLLSAVESVISVEYLYGTGRTLAYDQTRDQHLALNRTAVLSPPAPTNLPPGTPAGLVPITYTTTISLLKVGSPETFVETKLTPVYAGNSADLQTLTRVAVNADGSRYVLGDTAGALYLLDPGTAAITKVIDNEAGSRQMVGLAVAGDYALQISSTGELYRVDLLAGRNTYGQRELISGNSRGIGPLPDVPGGMTLASAHNAVIVSSVATRSLIAIDLDSGARTELSGPARGEGDAFVWPQDVVKLRDDKSVYVKDQLRLIAVDIESGDRVIMD